MIVEREETREGTLLAGQKWVKVAQMEKIRGWSPLVWRLLKGQKNPTFFSYLNPVLVLEHGHGQGHVAVVPVES